MPGGKSACFPKTTSLVSRCWNCLFIIIIIAFFFLLFEAFVQVLLQDREISLQPFCFRGLLYHLNQKGSRPKISFGAPRWSSDPIGTKLGES